ncbi:MAG: LysR family transcriptional regulator [Myxococcota bacterium]|nr:LysR family transcriptional regulator [Myxococcota bacterium]
MPNDEPTRNVAAMVVFARVVQEGSFSGAARRLGLSKATVSREIAELERRLGAQLLRRTTRRMSLTEVGELFHARCQRVVEEAEAAERSVSRLQAEPRGRIRLAAPMSFGHRQLAPRLPAFVARHPQVHVDVDLTDRTIDLVAEKFDLAVRVSAGRPAEQTLVARRLAPVRLLVCAAPAYLERAGTPGTPEALAEHVCLTYRPPPQTWAFAGDRSVAVRGPLNADNGDALREAALAGLGIVQLPTFLVGDDVRAGRLVPLLAEHTDRVGGVYSVYPESRHLSPKVRAFIDWLAEDLGPHPDWDRDLPPLPTPR